MGGMKRHGGQRGPLLNRMLVRRLDMAVSAGIHGVVVGGNIYWVTKVTTNWRRERSSYGS